MVNNDKHAENIKLFEELFQDFIREVPLIRVALRNAVTPRDHKVLAECAGKIRKHFELLGYEKVVAECQEIESAAQRKVEIDYYHRVELVDILTEDATEEMYDLYSQARGQ